MNKNNLLSVPIILLLAGCAVNQPMLPAPLDLPKKVQEYATIQPGAAQSETAPATEISSTPKPPIPSKTETIKKQPPSAAAVDELANITLAFEQMPLPSFIQVVYGATLKKNVNIDPAIVARQDLVTLRTGAPQTASQVAEAARMLLKSYGIAVVDLGSIVRIVPDNANLGYLPEIRRGRALPETPLPLRPIFQLVELQAVRNTDIASWIRTMFGDKVTVYEDPGRNAVWLSGQSENVTAALEAVHVLDQPLMKGRQSARITPAYMSADELAKKLAEILQAEGYSPGPPGVVSMPVTLVPVPSVNALIVFAADQAIVDHAVAWAKDLDKPGAKGIGRSFFSYQVKYIDAQALATTLDKILGGAPVAKPAGATAAAAVATSGRVVVDLASNTLIFQGSTEDYGQVKGLLELLDRPTRQALIEVTVAEVSLDDNSSLGIQWALNNAGLATLAATNSTGLGIAGALAGVGQNTVARTSANATLTGAGLNMTYARIDGAHERSMVLSALASNNRATILSSPRIVSRNGETATIQVGQEVPIVTTTQGSTTTTSTAPIQSVQYRNSGVILKVRPVIHSGNQIDLDVSQEVSVPGVTETGVASSPTFSTKRLETKLSLKDGATVLLGGLISSTGTKGNAGLPFLKDIPGLGALFGTNSSKNTRTELIVLITTYIISNDNDAQSVTDAFKRQLGSWANTVQPVKAPSSMMESDDKAADAQRKAAAPVSVPAPPQIKKPPEATGEIDQNANPGNIDVQPK